MFDLFVNISNIEGESSDASHRGWIEALTYSDAVFQKPSAAPSSIGGACAGQADFKPFAFSKQVDRASPLLAQACAAGTHIDTIRLEIWRSGSNKVKYMEYTLSDCLISAVLVASGIELPLELVKIDFGKIQWCYVQQDQQGGAPIGQIATGWNLEKNCRA